MASYPINKSPSISDGASGTLAFTEVRVCLECARIAEVEESRCPYCGDLRHTRTVLICHVTGSGDWPKVTIRNFGND